MGGAALAATQVCCQGIVEGIQQALDDRRPGSKALKAGKGHAVDAALLLHWRTEVCRRLVPIAQVAEHILSFLGTISPPPLMLLGAGHGKPISIQRGHTVSSVIASSPSFAATLPPHDVCAIAADVSGTAALLTASDVATAGISVWHASTLSSEGQDYNTCTSVLHGVEAPVRSLWLNVAANRAAAGLFSGTVQIWDFSAALLLVSCQAFILESTQWTTIGHTASVSMLTSAPGEPSSGQPSLDYNEGVRAGQACVLSGDPSGTICLWRDDGDCVMCRNACFVAQRTRGGTGHTAHSIASSPVGLVLVGLDKLVVGFSTPRGDVAFVLSCGDRLPVGDAINALAVSDCAWDPPIDDRASQYTGSVVAMLGSGSVMVWDITSLQLENRVLQGETPKVLRYGRHEPLAGVAASGSGGELAWLGIAEGGTRLTLTYMSLHSGTTGEQSRCSSGTAKEAGRWQLFEQHFKAVPAMQRPTSMVILPSNL